MTVTSGFFDSSSGDRKYNTDQLSRLFDGVIIDGIFASVGNAFVVTASTGMTVNVGTGRAWFFNTWTLNDAPLPLTLDPGEIALNRIDSIVLEVNKTTAVRANSIKVLKGSPATSPVAPTLTNTSTVKQYALATIFVGVGATVIAGGNITNKVGTTATPFVTGPLTTIDATELLQQFESQFNAWFANLQDQLDDNQAGNLQLQINALDTRTDALEAAVSAIDPAGWIPAPGTWAYSSSNTISVPSDATTRYGVGMRVRLKQGGGFKYFYITGVTATTITVNGGISYTLTGATITDAGYSTILNPIGFPAEHSWNPAFPNLTVGSGIMISKFRMNGEMVFGRIDFEFGTGSTFTGVATFVLPVPITSYTVPASSRRIIGSIGILDAGTTVFTGSVGVNGSSTLGDVRVGRMGAAYLELSNFSGTVPVTWAVGDSIGIQFSYVS